MVNTIDSAFFWYYTDLVDKKALCNLNYKKWRIRVC